MGCSNCGMIYERYIKKVIIEDLKTFHLCIFCLVRLKLIDESIFKDE